MIDAAPINPPVFERKTVYWFDERGQSHSGEQTARVTLTAEFTEDAKVMGKFNRLRNCHSWEILANNGFHEVLCDVMEHKQNGVPMVVTTGGFFVVEAWLSESKDAAFRNFVERVAAANGITKESA